MLRVHTPGACSIEGAPERAHRSSPGRLAMARRGHGAYHRCSDTSPLSRFQWRASAGRCFLSLRGCLPGRESATDPAGQADDALLHGSLSVAAVRAAWACSSDEGRDALVSRWGFLRRSSAHRMTFRIVSGTSALSGERHMTFAADRHTGVLTSESAVA
jgi:hypothetical protein